MNTCKRYAALAAVCAMALLGTACGGMIDELQSATEGETETTEAAETLSPEELASVAAELTAPIRITEPDEETVAEASEEESGETASEGTTDPSEEDSQSAQGSPFGAAVYLARSMEGEERYFFFTDAHNGSFLTQENGTGLGFTFDMDGENTAVFHMGAVDDNSRAEVTRIDDSILMLLWEDGTSETLNKLPNDPKEPFSFFSNEDLCARALAYYEQKNSYRPSAAAAMSNADGTIAIQLYDNLSDHNTTCDWYTVDRYTGIGTNIMQEEIDLSQVALS